MAPPKQCSLIFADAYGGLRYLLCLVEQQLGKGSAVTIVVIEHEHYAKLLNHLNEAHFGSALSILHVREYPNAGGNRIVRSLQTLFTEKYYLKEVYQTYFSEKSDYEVYFTARKYIYRIFYLVKRLSEKNTVYLLDADLTTNDVVSLPRTPAQWLRYFRLKLLYDWRIDFKREGHITFGQIGRRFISRYNISVLDRGIYKPQADQVLSKYAVKPGSIRVLLIDQNISELDMSDRREFRLGIERVGEVLSRYYPSSAIGVKRHPYFGRDNQFPVEWGIELEIWIPAELYITEGIDLVISFHSNALKVANNACAISLIDMLAFKPELQEIYKRYLLNNSANEIDFPNNIKEFEQLVIQYAGN